MRLLLIILVTATTLYTTLLAQWERCNVPNNTAISCFALSGTTIYAGTSGALLQSTNSGTSWNRININSQSMRAVAIDIYENRITVAAQGILESAVITSTDNGSSWTVINTGLTNSEVNSLARMGVTLFAGTPAGVFLTTNNGVNWVQANSGLTDTAVAALAVMGTTVVAATSSGNIFLSTNNGTKWMQTAHPATTSFNCMAVSGTNLYVGTHGDGLFVSTNIGTSWSAISTGLGDKKVLTLYADAPNLFAGTYGTGVVRSTNNGTSWEEINTGLLDLRVRAVIVHNQYLFAGSSFGIWRRKTSEVLSSAESSSTAITTTWCFPNPATEIITITTPPSLENSTGTIRYSVVNVQGEEVMHIDSDNKNVPVSTSVLPNGMYTIVATCGIQRAATTLLILR
ncbi:MAG: T9SS type A sorting domain-containing protein [Candidatus Kapabacteria bacterium]|nr:T9SS type A sorting domain-containing protein [Candidatus Kapabacteria bacterium]